MTARNRQSKRGSGDAPLSDQAQRPDSMDETVEIGQERLEKIANQSIFITFGHSIQ
jgi:hypothetical protein